MSTPPQQPQVAPRRFIPGTDAEFTSNVTNNQWSSIEQMPGIRQKASRSYVLVDENGKPVLNDKGEPITVNENLVSAFEMFTQDIRLGKLNAEEIAFVREHLDVAHDCLHKGYTAPALVVLERGISVIESSHAKDGWLRETLNTVNSNQKQEYYEPAKSLWTGKEKR